MFDQLIAGFLVAVLLPTIASASSGVPTCYYPDGAIASKDYACNLTAEASVCCGAGYACLDNKVCASINGENPPWNRGSCTDQSWTSPSCPQFCENFSSGGGSWVVQCDNINFQTPGQAACCYDVSASQPLDCCTNSTATVFNIAGDTNAYRTLDTGAATMTRQPSSTSPAQTSATTTVTSSSSGAATTSSATSSPTSASQPPSHVSGGAIAGIVIGAIAGVALIGAAIFFFLLRRPKTNKERKPDNGPGPQMALLRTTDPDFLAEQYPAPANVAGSGPEKQGYGALAEVGAERETAELAAAGRPHMELEG